jgi:hypothetical protein
LKTKSTIAILIIILCSCSEKLTDVYSIDQIPGKWVWESSCGGINYTCEYSSKSLNASIEFTSDGKYIEIHNDVIFLQSDYTLEKYDDMYGTLILQNPFSSRPVTIMNNRLMITRGELMDTYYKVK